MKTFDAKLVLKVIGRAVVFLVVLEVILRLGGLAFLFTQSVQNKSGAAPEGEYRILALGESTTALGGEASYPRQLETILNSTQNKIRFKVVNKGIPSITTGHIATRLEEYLAQHNPQMVVSMIGINDDPNAAIKEKAATGFFAQLRTIQLAKRLVSNALQPNKPNEPQKLNEPEKPRDPKFNAAVERYEKEAAEQPSAPAYNKLAGLYRASSQWDKEREALLKGAALDPDNWEISGYLGWHYKRFGHYQEAIDAFENMLKFAPRDYDVRINGYANLGEIYKLAGDYKNAERVYMESINYYPRHPGAYGCLGDVLLEQGRHDEAEALYKQQLAINPYANLFYGKLAHCYKRRGQSQVAENLLRQAVKINPQTPMLYAELGSYLIENQKYAEAENVLKAAMTLNPENFDGVDLNLNSNLLIALEKQGKTEEANALKKTLKAGRDYYNSETKLNYQKIRDTLSQKGIVLVAVQYPLRDIRPIKEMLGQDNHVVFVDNKGSFEEVIKKEGYDTYFTDRFAGDFGHCTVKGNHLLASNIAKAILEKLGK